MIAVVAGILVRDGKLLLCQRLPNKHNALKWEFPGGKLEAGESPEAALERELTEELRIPTRTGRIFDAIRCTEGDRDLMILFYFSEILSGEPIPVECHDLAWVNPDELLSFDLAPTDAKVAARLATAF